MQQIKHVQIVSHFLVRWLFYVTRIRYIDKNTIRVINDVERRERTWADLKRIQSN